MAESSNKPLASGLLQDSQPVCAGQELTSAKEALTRASQAGFTRDTVDYAVFAACH